MALLMARLTSAMWVGAALLFVLTSVAEQTSESLPDQVKNLLALIRFPWFYACGAVLIGVALVASLSIPRGGRRVTLASILLAIVLAMMAVDYTCIYRPLRERIIAAPAERSAGFSRLHRWSEGINACGFLLSAAAAGCLCAGGTMKE